MDKKFLVERRVEISTVYLVETHSASAAINKAKTSRSDDHEQVIEEFFSAAEVEEEE